MPSSPESVINPFQKPLIIGKKQQVEQSSCPEVLESKTGRRKVREVMMKVMKMDSGRKEILLNY